MNRLIFITGGARSGKSTFAEELAIKINKSYENDKPVAYIATAMVTDDEFRERIEEHKNRRGKEFVTFEEPMDIGSKAEYAYAEHNVILVECLTTWLGNIYFNEPKLKEMLVRSNVNNLVSLFTGKLDPLKKLESYNDFILGKEEQLPVEELFINQDEKNKTLIVVSNELGSGLVPAEKESREFRDDLGNINKTMAANSHYVYITVSGLPVRIK